VEKLGTWLAIAAVAVGFVILVWLLFSEAPAEKKKDKKKIGGRSDPRAALFVSRR